MKTVYILGGIGALLLLIVVILGSYVVSTLNTETRLHNLIDAKQLANTTEYDAMWKTIKQTANVTEAQRDAVMAVVVGYATARGGSKGSLATSLTEAIPHIDVATFTNLQNIIDSKRTGWTRNQEELVDLSRVHNNLINTIPSNIVCSIFGRKAVDIKLVTSTHTEEAFKTGKDDDTTLFNDNKK